MKGLRLLHGKKEGRGGDVLIEDDYIIFINQASCTYTYMP